MNLADERTNRRTGLRELDNTQFNAPGEQSPWLGVQATERDRSTVPSATGGHRHRVTEHTMRAFPSQDPKKLKDMVSALCSRHGTAHSFAHHLFFLLFLIWSSQYASPPGMALGPAVMSSR